MDFFTILIVVSMSVLMFFTGLIFDKNKLKSQLTLKGANAFVRLAIANYFAIPLATIAMVAALHLPPTLSIVLLTLSLLPCAPLVPGLISIAGKPADGALFTFAVFSVFNLGLVPIATWGLSTPWALDHYGELGKVESQDILRYVTSVYVPLGLGAALRIKFPAPAERLHALLKKFVPLMMLATFFLFLISRKEQIFGMGLEAFGAFALFEVLCAALAFAFLPNRETRTSTLLISCFRNFAMALAFLANVYPNTPATSYTIAFSTILVVITLAALRFTTRNTRTVPPQ